MKELSKRIKKVSPQAVAKIQALIANNPLISSEELIYKAREMGYDPIDLIDTALGSVKYEKSGAKLSDDLEDILNEVYKDDPTPGKRYVIEPYDISSNKGKSVARALEDNLGISMPEGYVGARIKPKYIAVRDQFDDLEKLKAITHAAHEFKHNEDDLIRPNQKPKDYDPRPYKKKHHVQDIFEPSELTREVRDIPKDPKVVKEVLKRSEKLGVKPSLFTRLRSVVGFIPAATALATSLYAPGSRADDIAQTISRATDEGDPTSLLFPPEAGEGEYDEIKKMYKEAEQSRKKDQELKEAVKPVVKEVGGEPDISPAKVQKMSGEQSSPDLEEMDSVSNFKDYLEKKKRQLGYQ